jgi:hypothetical protein
MPDPNTVTLCYKLMASIPLLWLYRTHKVPSITGRGGELRIVEFIWEAPSVLFCLKAKSFLLFFTVLHTTNKGYYQVTTSQYKEKSNVTNCMSFTNMIYMKVPCKPWQDSALCQYKS